MQVIRFTFPCLLALVMLAFMSIPSLAVDISMQSWKCGSICQMLMEDYRAQYCP